MSINRNTPNITKSLIALFLLIIGREASINLIGPFITNAIIVFLILHIVLVIFQSYGSGKKSQGTVVFLRSLYIKTKKMGVFPKIPSLVWGVAAAIGFTFIGIVFGYRVGIENESLKKSENDGEQITNYVKLIGAYEDETDLFLKQNDDVRILIDTDIIQNHPEELNDAIRSYYQKREELIFGAGRISELRKLIGLPGKQEL